MAGVDTNLEKYLHWEMKAKAVFCILGDKEKKHEKTYCCFTCIRISAFSL